MSLKQALTSLDKVNATLCSMLDGVVVKWGIRVSRVEIRALDPAPSIIGTMQKHSVSRLTDEQARAIATSGVSQESSSLRDRFATRADYAVAIAGRWLTDPDIQNLTKVNGEQLNVYQSIATGDAKRAARNSQIAMSFGFLILVAGAVIVIVT